MKRDTVIALCLLFAAISFAGVPCDAELAKLLVGKWKTTVDDPDAGIKGGGITEYRADGTFFGTGEVTVEGERIVFGAEGVWSVKDRILTWTVKKTLNPDVMAVDDTHTEEILEIDAKHIKYKGDEGEVEVETRITERQGPSYDP